MSSNKSEIIANYNILTDIIISYIYIHIYIYIISPVELPEANCRRSGCPPDAAPQRCDSQGQRCPESQDSPPGCNLEEGMIYGKP
jgi:hypothetical protein